MLQTEKFFDIICDLEFVAVRFYAKMGKDSPLCAINGQNYFIFLRMSKVQFGELLRTFLDQNKISVNKFARENSINSATLYNIFASKRRLPEEKLEKIMSGAYFDPSQKHELFESFYREKYGRAQYECVRMLYNHYKPSSQNEIVLPPMPPVFKIESGQTVTAENKNMIMSAIRTVFELAKDKNEIFTNYSFDHAEIDELVFALSKEKGSRLFHLRSKTDLQSLHESVRQFVRCARFNEIGINLYDVATDKSDVAESRGAFPFYFSTNGLTVVYSSGVKYGFITAGGKLEESINAELRQILISSRKTVAFPKNILKTLQVFQGLDGYRNYNCVPGIAYCDYLSTESLINLVNDAFSYKDKCVEVINGFIGMLERSFCVEFDELERFAATGRIYDTPETILKKVSPEVRRRVLERMLCDVQSGKIKIVNSNLQKFDSNVGYIYNEKIVCCLGMLKTSAESERYYGQFIHVEENEKLSEVFADYFDYIAKKGCIYSNDDASKLIENLILACELL